MLAALALVALAPRNGVIVIDGLAVGSVENGRWKTADGGRKDRARNYAQKPCFTLNKDGTLDSSGFEMKFSDEDEIESLQGWYLDPFDPENRVPAVWFGPKPVAPKMSFPSTGSPTYHESVKSFLRSKGVENPHPRIDYVSLTDLDGNGTREAVIFVTSRRHEEMWNTLSLDGKASHPSDFAAVLVRYVHGRSARYAEALYTDGRKGSLDGFWVSAWIWDLDGLKGSEILVASRYYEGYGGMVLKFSNGTVIRVAENVVGV